MVGVWIVSVLEEEKQEIADLMEDEGFKVLENVISISYSLQVDISVLDKLTGNPKPGDTLLYAVPM